MIFFSWNFFVFRRFSFHVLSGNTGDDYCEQKKRKFKINNVTFKYSGNDNNLTLFLKTIIHDHLVKNNIITGNPIKNVNNLPENKQKIFYLRIYLIIANNCDIIVLGRG